MTSLTLASATSGDVAGAEAAPVTTGDDLSPAASGTTGFRVAATPQGSDWKVLRSVNQSRSAGRVVYRSTSRIRAEKRAVRTYVQIRQLSNGRVVSQRTVRATAATGAWRTARVALNTQAATGRVLLRVKAVGPRGSALKLAKVRIGRTASATAPSTTAPSTTSPSTTNRRCISHKLGFPARGSAYAGAAVSGAISLPDRERYYGQTLPVHRLYFQHYQVSNAVNTVRRDLAANRLPWVSFKLPGTWAQMANGQGDAWARNIARQLDAVPGPVWLAFHHEPETDKSQDPRAWTRMQGRFARIVKANSDNIATSMIVTGWHQTDGPRRDLTLGSLWPGDGLIDVIGMDPYNFYGQRSGGRTLREMSNFRPWFRIFDNYAKAHGARWAIAEIGYNNEAASKDVTWIATAFRQMVEEGGMAFSYFDTTLHTNGNSWNLNWQGKRDQHLKNIRASARIC